MSVYSIWAALTPQYYAGARGLLVLQFVRKGLFLHIFKLLFIPLFVFQFNYPA